MTRNTGRLAVRGGPAAAAGRHPQAVARPSRLAHSRVGLGVVPGAAHVADDDIDLGYVQAGDELDAAYDVVADLLGHSGHVRAVMQDGVEIDGHLAIADFHRHALPAFVAEADTLGDVGDGATETAAHRPHAGDFTRGDSRHHLDDPVVDPRRSSRPHQGRLTA